MRTAWYQIQREMQCCMLILRIVQMSIAIITAFICHDDSFAGHVSYMWMCDWLYTIEMNIESVQSGKCSFAWFDLASQMHLHTKESHRKLSLWYIHRHIEINKEHYACMRQTHTHTHIITQVTNYLRELFMLNTVGVYAKQRQSINIIYPPSVIFVVEARHVARAMTQRNCTTHKQYCHLVLSMRAFFSLLFCSLFDIALVQSWNRTSNREQIETHNVYVKKERVKKTNSTSPKTNDIFHLWLSIRNPSTLIRSLVVQINYSVAKVPDCMQPHDYHSFFFPQYNTIQFS